MLPIIAVISDLKRRGYTFKVKLPNDQNVATLFLRTNWAHLLHAEFNRSDPGSGRHLNTRQFKDDRDIADLTNDFMHVVLRSMSIPRDIIRGLEWSIYEICDNVINHSESPVGGFIEAVTYTKEKKVTFTVADAGKGILNSLREGLPDLQTHTQAIGEAIKVGVTRNKDVGQGNGLAGSLRITTKSGGSIDITSGAGRFYCTPTHNKSVEEATKGHYYNGTSVSGQIVMNENFSIGDALEFGGINYTPIDIIEMQYEMEDQDAMLLSMKRETSGVGTRKSGKQLRLQTINLINAQPGFPIFIDWDGIPVISSSFADEFIAKLYFEIGHDNFQKVIRFQNTEPLTMQLIEKAIAQRIAQEKK